MKAITQRTLRRSQFNAMGANDDRVTSVAIPKRKVQVALSL